MPVTQGIDGAETALIVVDMQNHFCHPDGQMAQRGEDIGANLRAVTRLTELLPVLRAALARTIYLRQVVTAERVAKTRRRLARGEDGGGQSSCAPGNWGFEIVDELRPATGDIVVDKPRYSGFVATVLEEILEEARITTLVVTGTAANVCVDTTVRDADARDFRVVVAEDLVGYTRPELGRAALENLSIYFAEVATGAEIVDAVRASRPITAVTGWPIRTASYRDGRGETR